MTCLMVLGPRCRVIGAQPELVLALEVARAIAESQGVTKVTVAHLTDGTHSVGSLHYVGAAADLTISPGEDDNYETLANAVRAALGQDFDVLNESRHSSNQHCHLEHQPKKGLNL